VLLAVPNVSEGRDPAALEAIGAAFGPGMIHASSDPDHHRAVFTVRGGQGELARRVLDGAREAVARIDLKRHEGAHPRVGAVDVAPIVYLRPEDRGAAVAEALVLAELLGTDLGVPVFLYGALADGRTRADLRRGGPEQLQRRIDRGELAPHAGPRRLHPTAGATLVAARPPLAAFNVEVDAPVALAKEIAARIREGGAEGLRGVRALGLELARAHTVQVSTNIEDLEATTPTDVVEGVRRHARVTGAELIAPAPARAFASFPPDVALRGAPLLP
jgi:glutamate formiminotransferase / 5-formyltetrahydrofolate cyclo-ligase